MAYELEHIHAEQGRLVRELFVDTAAGRRSFWTARSFASPVSVERNWRYILVGS